MLWCSLIIKVLDLTLTDKRMPIPEKTNEKTHKKDAGNTILGIQSNKEIIIILTAEALINLIIILLLC